MNRLNPLSRRQFVRSFSYGAAFSMILGKPWRSTVLADFAPAAAANTGILKVRLSDYPALLDVLGSVRLGFSPIDEFTQMPVGLDYPIIINRASTTTFYALNSYCHHMGCVVPIYDANDAAMICPCHGSTYAIDGRLISDGPSSGPLTRYQAIFDGENTLSIHLPGLRYSVQATAVAETTPSRMKLVFPTLAAVNYEVFSRATLSDPWSATGFSLTADGPADQSLFIGNDSNAEVYVDRTAAAGFYQVAIQMLDLSIINPE